MKKTKLITAVLLIMLAACLCSCSSSRRGAAIDSVELYCYTAEGDGFTCGYADEDKTATYRMNIRWHDNDPDRQLEFLELTFLGKFSGDYEGNDHLRYRIFPYRDEYDWDSTGPMVCSVPGLVKGEKYKVYVSKAVYTDGSSWNNTKRSGKKTARVDGNRGKGMPAVMEELNFYEQKYNAIDKDMNVCWVNAGKVPLIGVTYEVQYRNLDGDVIKDRSGKSLFYYECHGSEEVLPGEESTFYHISLKSNWALEETPVYIDVRIVKAIGEGGKVYENADGAPLSAVFLGKKSYAFGNSRNKNITSLEKSIRAALEEAGISRTEALIYEKEKDFAVLRYDGFDIRVELDEKGKVKKDSVSFVDYFTTEDFETRFDQNGVNVFERDLAIAVYRCVLKDLKQKEIREKVTGFYSTFPASIDFSAGTYSTIYRSSVIKDENYSTVFCSICGLGKEFDYDPYVTMFWAYNTIYF